MQLSSESDYFKKLDLDVYVNVLNVGFPPHERISACKVS